MTTSDIIRISIQVQGVVLFAKITSLAVCSYMTRHMLTESCQGENLKMYHASSFCQQGCETEQC